MVINHNMASLFSQRMNGLNEMNVQKDMAKLSSGMKITKAGDDSSGLAISEKMRSQIRGLNRASQNISDGINFTNTAAGYLEETTDIIQRLRELAVQSSNGIYSDEDRAMIQVEVSQLVSEVDRIAESAQFNGYNILTGRFAENGLSLQVGANMDQNITIKVGDMSAAALGLGSQEGGLTLDSVESANAAIGTLDEALKTVNRQRADLGAMQNRMETAVKGINVAAENMQASESKIRDADIAEEMVNYSRDAILNQSSLAMVAQANSQNANVLALLR